jgi:hypothetical protein
MTRCRYQSPEPKSNRELVVLLYWVDKFEQGRRSRRRNARQAGTGQHRSQRASTPAGRTLDGYQAPLGNASSEFGVGESLLIPVVTVWLLSVVTPIIERVIR